MSKALPNSPEAEQSTLGAMLLERNAIAHCLTVLEARDFYREPHAELFAAMQQLHLAGVPVDLQTLSQHLRDRGKLDQVGGIPYLTDLLEATPTGANVARYAAKVRAKAVQRRMIRAAHEIQQQAWRDDVEDVEGLLAWSRTMLDQVALDDGGQAWVPMSEVLAENLADIRERRRSGESLRGVPTGLWQLDRLLGGLVARRLYIVGARPKKGKTSLTVNWCAQIAIEAGLPAAFFSVEMARQELADKWLGLRANVNTRLLQSAQLSDEHLAQVTEAAREPGAANCYVCDRAEMTIDKIRAHGRLAVAQYGARVIFVDYMQIVQGHKERNGTRRTEMDTVARGLKAMARELDVPVVALSQLSRLEGGHDSRPTIQDLKESGGLEAEADAVILLHSTKEDPGRLELIVAAQRHGPVGVVSVDWEPATQRISM